MHGPNGSAKSTIVACLMAALENYSTLDEGALYRFNWVFPSAKTVRGSLGFGQGSADATAAATYAHLADDEFDAKLLVEVRDHPLFLIPLAERGQFLQRALSETKTAGRDAGKEGESLEPACEWLVRGQLSHKSQQVFEALLSSYHGSYTEVLKHVQVERYFISQRYRVGAVTIGPQMSVDASERQVTADRSLLALPASLQAMTLFEARGELVDAGGGLLEFSDLLKRPLDAFKYLQLSIETGEVSLGQQNVPAQLRDGRERQRAPPRRVPRAPRVRELPRSPRAHSYALPPKLPPGASDLRRARLAADPAPRRTSFKPGRGKLRRLNADEEALQRQISPSPLGSALSGLTALEKADLYATGRAPDRLEPDVQRALATNLKEIYKRE